MSSSLLLPVLVVFIAFFFFWQWRSNRRRRAEEEKKSAGLVKGVEVMTSFGLFGTVDSIDLENNKVVLETSPGNFITVHRQAIGRVETPADQAPTEVEAPGVSTSTSASSNTSSSAIAAANAAAKAQAAGASDQPKFGERKSDD